VGGVLGAGWWPALAAFLWCLRYAKRGGARKREKRKKREGEKRKKRGKREGRIISFNPNNSMQ
jgi:hypothetical protein